jgi:hypothetical protein
MFSLFNYFLNCMKTIIRLLLIVLISTLLFSCKTQNSHNIIHEKKLLNVYCSNEINHSYAIYVPSHEQKCSEMPVIIVLDPHGAGNSVINSFITASEKYKFIVAASNLVKNNYPSYNQSINNLVEDVKSKNSSANSVYLCGFSGGARMAISYAQSHKIDGILACGALAGNNELIACQTNIYSVMGMSDFNFPEIASYIISPELKPNSLFLEIAGDIHEWPDSSVLSRCIGYLITKSAKNNNSCLSKKQLLNNLEKSFLDIAGNMEQAQEYIKAKQLYSNLMELENLKHGNLIREKLESILNSSGYKSEFLEFKQSLEFERKVREAYYNAFNISDINWWNKEILGLNHQIEVTTDKYDLLVYKRIKAFLGIMCYSLSRNSIFTNDLEKAQKILAIYKNIEPQNPDMFFYTALYNLKSGNKQIAKELLKTAIEHGFNDTTLIKQNFPVVITKEIF